MLRFKAGDQGAFEQLLRRHQRPVFHFALRSLGNQQGAEDALQEIFLRVVRHAGSYEKKAKFTTWLYTIARNHCIDHARKQKFRRTESLDAPASAEPDAPARIDSVAGDGLGADDSASAGQIRRALDAALQRLPPEQREVFLLREHAGIPFKEIGDMTGVSENTVKSRMRYALEALRNHLSAAGVRP